MAQLLADTAPNRFSPANWPVALLSVPALALGVAELERWGARPVERQTPLAPREAVTLGKQLTRELYVGYEYGLKSAEQALKVSYQLSRTLSLIGRAGRDASTEVRYTRRFD